jgi:hypothetical protein
MLRSISETRDQPYAQVVEESLNSLLMKDQGVQAAAVGELLLEPVLVHGTQAEALLLLRHICR